MARGRDPAYRGRMRTPRVLIADDEEDIRFMLELHLGRAGYAVSTVADGQAAVDALADGTFDFALCDLVMPALTGLEVISRVAELGISTPIVLMSAHADVDTALKAVAHGAFDYISKPFRADEVLFRLRRALEQQALAAEVGRLKAAISNEFSFAGIIARSDPMKRVFRTIRKVADYKTTVLLSGESGTGKELVAKALHFNSVRKSKPFVPINCGAIPEALLESELFGHVRGAFTDATRTRTGLFEEADSGTLFLDEVGELPLSLQVKLLRVLQEGEIRRVGDSKARPVDVRIIAATVRDLAEEVKHGRFREDLYYRLNVLPLSLPPLRARRSDIPLLLEHFVARLNERLGTDCKGIEPDAMKMLMQHEWPGNVRELENAVERSIVLAETDTIGVADLPERIKQASDRIRMSLASGELSIKKTTRIIEEELIRRALTLTEGNRTRASELLEISHRALLYKIKEYAVEL